MKKDGFIRGWKYADGTIDTENYLGAFSSREGPHSMDTLNLTPTQQILTDLKLNLMGLSNVSEWESLNRARTISGKILNTLQGLDPLILLDPNTINDIKSELKVFTEDSFNFENASSNTIGINTKTLGNQSQKWELGESSILDIYKVITQTGYSQTKTYSNSLPFIPDDIVHKFVMDFEEIFVDSENPVDLQSKYEKRFKETYWDLPPDFIEQAVDGGYGHSVNFEGKGAKVKKLKLLVESASIDFGNCDSRFPQKRLKNKDENLNRSNWKSLLLNSATEVMNLIQQSKSDKNSYEELYDNDEFTVFAEAITKLAQFEKYDLPYTIVEAAEVKMFSQILEIFLEIEEIESIVNGSDN